MSKPRIRRNTLIRLARKSGIKRISKEALKEVESFILEITEKVCRRAIEYASHAKRMTVKKDDVELATR
jgi:histone H3/H4